MPTFVPVGIVPCSFGEAKLKKKYILLMEEYIVHPQVNSMLQCL